MDGDIPCPPKLAHSAGIPGRKLQTCADKLLTSFQVNQEKATGYFKSNDHDNSPPIFVECPVPKPQYLSEDVEKRMKVTVEEQ